MAVAGELHVEGLGYGPLIANILRPDPPSAPPARSGRGLGADPQAATGRRGVYAGEIEWECEVALEPCDDAAYAGGILEYVYGVSTLVDKSGYTKRTIRQRLDPPDAVDG